MPGGRVTAVASELVADVDAAVWREDLTGYEARLVARQVDHQRPIVCRSVNVHRAPLSPGTHQLTRHLEQRSLERRSSRPTRRTLAERQQRWRELLRLRTDDGPGPRQPHRARPGPRDDRAGPGTTEPDLPQPPRLIRSFVPVPSILWRSAAASARRNRLDPPLVSARQDTEGAPLQAETFPPAPEGCSSPPIVRCWWLCRARRPARRSGYGAETGVPGELWHD